MHKGTEFISALDRLSKKAGSELDFFHVSAAAEILHHTTIGMRWRKFATLEHTSYITGKSPLMHAGFPLTLKSGSSMRACLPRASRLLGRPGR